MLLVAGGQLLVCFDAAYKPRIRQRLKKWGISTALQIAIGDCHRGDAVAMLNKLHEIKHLCLQVRRQG